MNIGITYDTATTYGLADDNQFLCDLCDLESIEHISNALSAIGHNVIKLEGIAALLNNTKPLDLVLNSAEGIASRNREALLPAILEAKKIPYIGADAYISVLSLDKLLFSECAKNLGVLCPRYTVIESVNLSYLKEELEDKQLEYPLIVKPNTGGNSSATYVCQHFIELYRRCQQILEILPSEKLIVQEFIRGIELTVPVFDNGDNTEIFDIIGFKEQSNDNFWINANQKVFGGVTEVVIQLNDTLVKRIKDICKKLYRHFDFRDYTRFDFRIMNENIYFLEANAFPYLGEDGAMYQSYINRGSYSDFLSYLINIAKNRYHSINSKSHK